MYRQIPCKQEEHEFTRSRIIETTRVGLNFVEIHYDIYICKICDYTFKIITNEKTIKEE